MTQCTEIVLMAFLALRLLAGVLASLCCGYAAYVFGRWMLRKTPRELEREARIARVDAALEIERQQREKERSKG